MERKPYELWENRLKKIKDNRKPIRKTRKEGQKRTEILSRIEINIFMDDPKVLIAILLILVILMVK